MKKIISVFMIFIFGAFLLAGCTSNSAPDDELPVSEEADLEIWMCYDRNVPGSYYVFLWDDLAEEYGYTVNVKTYSQSELEDKLRLAMMSNELPDIFMVPGGAYPEYLFESGACLPVQSYLREVDFLEEYTLPYSDGNNYLIPCLPKSYGVTYYDESLMEQIGLSEPETWEDLLDLIDAVKAYNAENGTDYAAIELGIKDSWMGELLFCMIAERLDPELYSELSEEREEEVHELLLQSAECIRELRDRNAFPSDYMEIGEQESVRDFINHDAVLMVHQSSMVYHLIQNMGVDGFVLSDFPCCNNDYLDSYSKYVIDLDDTFTPGLAISARSAYCEQAADLCMAFATRVNEINVEEYDYLNIMKNAYELPDNSYTNVTAIHTLTEQAVQTEAFLYDLFPQDSESGWDALIKRFFAEEITSVEFADESMELLFGS
ncbi:MAG: ABC transporter substrate-binding protein [Lachnospiraceae bacterium]|nr:ABC transporter substrate-binding protein [Lachnospiraceae bacterium]